MNMRALPVHRLQTVSVPVAVELVERMNMRALPVRQPRTENVKLAPHVPVENI